MHKTAPLSQLEDHLGYWIRCLSNLVHNCFAQKLKRYDISVEQWVVLRTLFDHAGITLQETAALIGVDNSSLSRMIERLVKKGLVMRDIHPKSRRTVFLTLSAQAKELVPLLVQEADTNDRELFKSLDDSQKNFLLDTVKTLLITNGWDQKSRGKDAMQ